MNTENPPAYQYTPLPTSASAPANASSPSSHYKPKKPSQHNQVWCNSAHNHGTQRHLAPHFEIPEIVITSPQPSESMLDGALERAGFVFFFLLTVVLFGYGICVFVLITAEFSLVPMAILQLFEKILVVNLHIPSYAIHLSFLSALCWSLLLLNILQSVLPSFLAHERTAAHSIWHHTRREWVFVFGPTMVISLYAWFSDVFAEALLEGNEALGGRETMEGMLWGAKWAVGGCVLLGAVLVVHHWRKVRREGDRSQAELEDFA